MVPAPVAFRETMASAKNLDWLHNVPEHFKYPRFLWGTGWSSKNGADLRAERQNGWTKPWPPASVMLYRMVKDKRPNVDILSTVLADWVENHDASVTGALAQELWESGGFLIPSLCPRLVHAGASINCKLWKYEQTALQIAASFGEHDLVRRLLDLGADPKSRSGDGYIALHWLFLHQNPIADDNRAFHFRRREGYRVPRYEKCRISASIKALTQDAENAGSLVNITYAQGKTALMLAVQTGPTSVKALLEEGAKVDCRDAKGRTALMHFLSVAQMVDLCQSYGLFIELELTAWRSTTRGKPSLGIGHNIPQT